MNVDSPEYQRASAAHLKHIAEVITRYNDERLSGARAGDYVIGGHRELTPIQDVSVQLSAALDVCGLALQEVEVGQTFTTRDESVTITELRANIADKSTFMYYLSGIDRDTIDDDAYRALAWFADQMIEQLVRVYNLNDPSGSQFLDCIASLNAMIERYENLDPVNDHGLIAQTERLHAYRHAAQQKYLREYVAAENHSLFEEIGSGFNASRWHIDSNKKDYQQWWNKVSANVIDMKKNPNAEGFAQSMITYLLRSIDYARADIINDEGTEFPYLDKPEKLQILDEMEDRLRGR